MRLYTIIVSLVMTSSATAQVIIISEPTAQPPAAGSSDSASPEQGTRPAVVPVSFEHCPGGVCWTYSNGLTKTESYAAYSKRTGKSSPATRMQCSTGFCGTAARSPTLAASGCQCGCRAALCSCAHSPNVGKPLKSQTVFSNR